MCTTSIDVLVIETGSVERIEGLYNRNRIHTAIGGLTPVEYEQRLKAP